MNETKHHKTLGERERRILARWISVFLPEVVEEMKQDGDPNVPRIPPEDLETPRFKFGNEVHDKARCRHQMQHEAFQVARSDNQWLAEETVRCPRCGKVTVGNSVSGCSGCGMSIPRRQMVAETPTPIRHSRQFAFYGVLGIATIIALGLAVTFYLTRASHAIPATTKAEEANETKIPGEWRTIRSAVKVVRHFHYATSVEEKASLVRNFEGRRQTLTQHYLGNPFEPSHVDKIIKTGWYEVDGLVSYLIHGSYSDGNEFLAFVCEQDGQLALDWQAFTGHNPLPFTEFLDQEPEDPVAMRVVAQSISVEPFPELAQNYRFYQLHDKDRKDTCWALVEKHSEAGQTLASLIAQPDPPSFELFSTTSDVAAETSRTPPRRLILKLRYDDALGIVIDGVISAEWLDQPVPADIHFDV